MRNNQNRISRIEPEAYLGSAWHERPRAVGDFDGKMHPRSLAWHLIIRGQTPVRCPMRRALPLLLSLTAAAALLSQADDANACGGCFVQESENTQVTGHRMIMSLSMDTSTLWDQITYDGAPESFAWVLPIKGTVDIGLSSDALFNALDQLTAVTISSPTINCPPPPSCGENDFASAGTGGGGGEDGGVTVLAQEVVGPYETVQLSADDPQALTDWLESHQYNVPSTIQSTIDAYVGEKFNFLAMKLVPGEGVDSMRPVRITTQGAATELPLRMVAAGTGAVTPILLWVMAEGRYEPQNFPSFEIDPAKLVWDWDTSSSNYKALRDQGFDATGGLGWLAQAAEPFSLYSIEYLINDLAMYDPKASGYGDENGEGAMEEAAADLGALFAGLDPQSSWVSRMYAELPQVALATDLALTASANQDWIQRYMEAPQSVGTPPACQEFPPCDDGVYQGDDGFGLLPGNSGALGSGDGVVHEVGGGCSVSGNESGVAGALLGLIGLAAAERRRSARKA